MIFLFYFVSFLFFILFYFIIIFFFFFFFGGGGGGLSKLNCNIWSHFHNHNIDNFILGS